MNKELAVEIAKDILKNINKFSFQRGIYVAPKFNFNTMSMERLIITNLFHNDVVDRKCVKDLREKCNVCALGSMIVSLAKFSKIKKKSFEDRKSIVKQLAKVFHRKDINLIEDAFEANYESGSKLENFLINLWDSNVGADENRLNYETLKAICQNIIDNDGRFKP